MRVNHRISKRSAGFTLIELMLTVVISSIVMGMTVYVVSSQQRAFLTQMDYSRSHQNGRAAIELIKRYVRLAGTGFPAVDEGLKGSALVGACYDFNVPNQQQFSCDNKIGEALDEDENDRLRILFMKSRSDVTYEYDIGSAASTGTHIGPGAWGVGDTTANFPLASLGVIAGTCNGGASGMAADLVYTASISADGVNSDGDAKFDHTYTLNEVSAGCGSTGTASDTFDSGFTFGKAGFADIYIDRTGASPSLRLRTDPTAAVADGWLVAKDIDDLQISYHLDIDSDDGNPDGVADAECNDISSAATCPELFTKYPAIGFTDSQRASHIVAVDVAIVVRSSFESRYKEDNPADYVFMDVKNHSLIRSGDGYRRWIYRTTVMLRNNQL